MRLFFAIITLALSSCSLFAAELEPVPGGRPQRWQPCTRAGTVTNCYAAAHAPALNPLSGSAEPHFNWWSHLNLVPVSRTLTGQWNYISAGDGLTNNTVDTIVNSALGYELFTMGKEVKFTVNPLTALLFLSWPANVRVANGGAASLFGGPSYRMGAIIIADGSGTVLTFNDVNGSGTGAYYDDRQFQVANSGTYAGSGNNVVSFNSKPTFTASVPGTYTGFWANPLTSSNVSTAIGFDVTAMAASTTNIGYRSAITAASGHYFLQDTGGAQSKFTGLISTYNNIAKDTAHNGMPFTVASPAKLTAQGANVTATTFTGFSSVTAGRYRMCCVVAVTRQATTSATVPTCTLTCTDPTDSVAKTIQIMGAIQGVAANPTTSVANSGCGICDAKVSTAIQYGTANYASAGGTSMQYDFFATLEAM